MTSITSCMSKLKHRLEVHDGIFDLLSPSAIDSAARAAGHSWRNCFWTPTTTVLTFLRQILHANCSCRHAVAMTVSPIMALSDDLLEDMVSGDPSAYSQARQKLPIEVFDVLNRQVVAEIGDLASSESRWCGREVVVVDGSGASMPDNRELQKAFPQPGGQTPGCGFPVTRLVAVFCWASGIVRELASDSLKVGELILWRPLLKRLVSGTVVLGDTYFGSYFDLAMLQEHKLDGVFRLHQRRPADFRRGRRLGRQDQLLTWEKPKLSPKGVPQEQWAHAPQTLTVRHVRADIEFKGFRRRRHLDIVTTLLDPVAFPAERLCELYRDRWYAELNLRSLKTTLHMEVLKGQSVEMIRKELAVYRLAYNLIRLLMWRTAQSHDVSVRRLSFAGAQQRILAALPNYALCDSTEARNRFAKRLMHQIASGMLPSRPDRFEPRCVKRRRKQYTLMKRPRETYKCRDDDQYY